MGTCLLTACRPDTQLDVQPEMVFLTCDLPEGAGDPLLKQHEDELKSVTCHMLQHDCQRKVFPSNNVEYNQ